MKHFYKLWDAVSIIFFKIELPRYNSFPIYVFYMYLYINIFNESTVYFPIT